MVFKPMSQDLESVLHFLLRLRRRLVFAALARRTAGLASILLLCCTAVQILFAVFPWVVLPMAWDFLLAAMTIAACVIACDILFLHKPSLLATALAAEGKAHCAHPWLSLSLELAGQRSECSESLKRAVFEKAAGALAQCAPAAPESGLRRNAVLLLVSLFVFLSSAIFLQPQCARFWKMPFSYFAPVRAEILPGTVCIPGGSTCVVRLIPRSVFFPSCRLALFTPGGALQKSSLLAADSAGRFSFTLDSVTQSLSYQFSVGNTVFPADTINVVSKPLLSRLQIRVTPPSYTGIRSSNLLDGQGNFVAYPGTRAHIALSAPHPLLHALFISSRKDTIPFPVSHCDASGDIVVSSRQSYTFSLTDTFLQKSDSVPLFSIDVIPDAPPSVFIVKPGRSRDCSPEMSETLMVEAIDDIGIRSAGVRTRKNGDSAFAYADREVPQSEGLQKLLRLELPLSLAGLSLYPGDTLYYWAIACDNREYGWPQCAISDTFFFRVPTFEEIRERAAEEQNYTEHALVSAGKHNDELRQSLDNLMKSSQGKQSLSWEQQQIVRDLKEGVAAQADSLSKAVESFRQAVDKLKQQDAAPGELLSKMDEVQKAIEDLRRQYGDSLLFSPPGQADNLSLRDMKESLEKLKKALPDLANRLEATLKFLQALKRDMELGRMAADAERLAREQKENTAAGNAGACLSKQEKICTGIDGLLKDIDNNAGKPGDSSLFSREQLPALGQICPLQKTMRSSLLKRTAPNGNDMNGMAASLMSLSEDISSMQSCALAKKLDKEREVLLDMAHDGLSMSAWQKAIAEESFKPSGSAGETAALEQALKNSLDKSMIKMDRLAMVPPRVLLSIKKSYDNAGASLSGALSYLSSDNGRIFSRDGEAGLNNLTQTVLDAIAQLGGQQSQGGGMGSMMSGLRRLSSKQAMLNAATGGLLRSLLGQDGLSGGSEGKGRRDGGKEGGQGRAREEARAAQKAIANELKRLADKYGKEAGASLDKKARELEDEARRLSNMFDNPSQELRDRQDRFLSRLLETSLSQHKQDEGREERVSQSAKNIFPSQKQDAPAAASFDFDTYYRLRQRAFSGNFPESYRFSVKNYFDSLGVLFLKEK
jgi:hypothetical protein